MSFLLVGSIGIHAAFVTTAFILDRHPRALPAQEINVELVREPAKPSPPKPQLPALSKPSGGTQPQQAKRDLAQAQPPKAQPAKPRPSAPHPPKKVEPEHKTVRPADDEAKLKALQAQLDRLNAERAALDAQRAAQQALAAKAERAAKPTPSPTERLQQLLGESQPSMGAMALPGESATGTEAASYKQLVLSKVAKAKKEGRYQGIPAYSTVAFEIGDKGEVVSSTIERDSGDASLNQEALAMVKRGEPYPPPPPGAGRTFVITLRFSPLG